MELLVACTLAIVAYCSYLTGRDIVNDLRREGLLETLVQWRGQLGRRGGRIDRLYVSRSGDDPFPFLPRRSPVAVTYKASGLS